ncbi:MAG: formylglycine-generating enzyme family protein, partial [Candidatus Eisenbacteria bacterium]|nr:formylglycine-generating enzyme family protein [Candidatus Eisenbacteria bacterium]
ILFGISASHGELRMRIHQGVSSNYYSVAEIDSVTFFDMFQLVTVPAGIFMMGDGEASCGLDEHEVTLTRDFYLGQHEVTNLEYLEMVQWAFDQGYVTATTVSLLDNLDGGTELLLDFNNSYSEIQFDGAGTFYLRQSPSNSAQYTYPDGYDPSAHPIQSASWYGAARFCDWLSLREGLPRAYAHTGDWACNNGDPYSAQGYRLPTDAEWEYAAQYDDERIYPWGNEPHNCNYANCNCISWTRPIGSFPDAPGLLTLSDMAGNVYEWCNDWWLCELGTTPVTDPVDAGSGNYRVIRGGSWNASSTEELRCSYRSGGTPSYPYRTKFGFRLARTVNP